MAKIPGGGGGGEARSGGARGTTTTRRRRARGRARGGGGGRRGRGGGAPRAGKEGKGTCVGLFKRLHVPNVGRRLKKIRCEVGNLVQLVCELSSFNGDLQSLRSLKGLFPCLLRWLRAFRSCVTCYKPIKSIVGAPMGSVPWSDGWLTGWLAFREITAQLARSHAITSLGG